MKIVCIRSLRVCHHVTALPHMQLSHEVCPSSTFSKIIKLKNDCLVVHAEAKETYLLYL